jgi:hypothetical protein
MEGFLPIHMPKKSGAGAPAVLPAGLSIVVSFALIPEPISSDPWQSMENQPFPTLSVISDRSELSGIGIIWYIWWLAAFSEAGLLVVDI